jgi:rubrerythrin
MLAKFPIDLSKVDKNSIDQEILRAGLIAELDAISLYEQFAANATDPKIKKVMLAVAKEEKEHVGEFKALLDQMDSEQVEMYDKGATEVEEETT